MALAPGTRFGSYEVVEQIGSGGMGEVWRATDTSLKRGVALKVLPKAFVEDADRLARFRREAEILASLNHPNIATIHAFEKTDDQTVIVMELVDGPTLEDRIKEGPIPADESMGMALQIVAALEAAHARQIVHRDLKPANVKVREDGTVKVLDFGISKPIDPTTISGGAATTPAVTETGVILGTAAYMSPEQAQGKFVDQRTDIWAFGCLLFEMLTGQPAFSGENVMAILARVIDRDTDLSSMPKTISPAVRHAIRLCLEKDPRKRIADIRDVRLALEGRFESRPSPGFAASDRDAPSAWRRALPWATAAAGALAAVLILTFIPQSYEDADEVVRTSIPLPPDQKLTGPLPFALSPDGKLLVYTAASGGQPLLYRRPLGEYESVPIDGTEGAEMPFFSPDGRSVAFFAGGKLKSVSLDGGLPLFLADAPFPTGGAWSDDGWIVFGPTLNNGLWRVTEDGHDLEQLTMPDFGDGGYAHAMPQFLPGSRDVLFTVAGAAYSAAVLSLDTMKWKRILPSQQALYLSTGHLLFDGMDNQLSAIAFDPTVLQTSGNRIGVLTASGFPSCCASVAVSRSGTLAYMAPAPPEQLVWVDMEGRSEAFGDSEIDYRGAPRPSPGGGRVALTINNGLAVATLDIASGVLTTVQPALPSTNYGSMAWIPDSSILTFSSDRAGSWDIYSVDVDGGAEADALLVREFDQFPESWSPDGLTLLYGEVHPVTSYDIWTIGSDGQNPQPFVVSPGNEQFAQFSPLGGWVAYTSDVSGRDQIFVCSFPDCAAERRVVGNGAEPVWSPDGRTLYFRNGRQMLAADVVDVENMRLGVPRVRFEGPYRSPQNFLESYDIDPSGERFLMFTDSSSNEIRIVQHWDRELLERVPVD